MIDPQGGTMDSDGLWDVKQAERQETDFLRRSIDTLDRAIGLATKAQALEHAPGYAEFVKAVEGVRDHAFRELLGTEKGSDYMHRVQGRCQAFDNVLTLLQRSRKNTELLVARRGELQNQLDEAMRRRPKPRGK